MSSIKRKILLFIIAILLIICLFIGISYAYWKKVVNQDSSNVIKSGCLNITLEDKTSAINLEKTYPISDNIADTLNPYEFTITNTCSKSIDYDVTLEIMDEKNRLDSSYIAVNFNDEGKKLLSNFTSVDATYSDEDYTAKEARNLGSGTLDGNSSVSYTLKLWIDESVTSTDAMNKTFTSKISVTINQEEDILTFAKYITALSESDTTNLIIDETDDKNIRYIGSNPNNYVCFDSSCTNGVWRVIGLMNNMITSTGKKTSLVKLIRKDSIGNYVWDTNNINDWSTSSLNTYLNGDWYNSNLSNYDNLVENVVWNVGGCSSSTYTDTFYNCERGDVVYEGRPTTWTGKVALMYPSDYGYATSGGANGRTNCLSYYLYRWKSYSGCYSNDFLYYGSGHWFLTTFSTGSYGAFVMSVAGYTYHVDGDPVKYSRAIRPTIYLNSKVQIISGDGTNNSPWIIGR